MKSILLTLNLFFCKLLISQISIFEAPTYSRAPIFPAAQLQIDNPSNDQLNENLIHVVILGDGYQVLNNLGSMINNPIPNPAPLNLFDNTPNLKLAAHNGTLWKDLGNGGTTGNLTTGTIKTAAAATIYGYYTLATTDTFRCVKCEADAGEDKEIRQYRSLFKKASTLNENNNGSFFNWVPINDIHHQLNGFATIIGLSTKTFELLVTNSFGCIAKDSFQLNVIPVIIDNMPLPCLPR